MAPTRIPGTSPHRPANRRVDRVASDRADQPHVDEVGPERRHPAVAEQQALHDQHRGNHDRPGPGTEQHRRENAAEEMAGDRQREERKVDHLRGEDERRHDPHQHRRPFRQMVLQLPQAEGQAARRDNAGRRRDGRGKHGVWDVHGDPQRHFQRPDSQYRYVL